MYSTNVINAQMAFAEPASDQIEALYEAIERIEAILDQETALLRQNKAANFHDFNLRKRQGLLELNRTVRALNETKLPSEGRQRIMTFKAKLEENSKLLHNHLKALEEISVIVTRAIQDSESDGTYSCRAG